MNTEQLPHLFTFLTVAECGSFTAAGRRLDISQAAVSLRVQSLEASLGTKLFVRAGGQCTLTNAGRKVFDYARQIAALHADLRAALTGAQESDDGDLLLAASSIPGNYVLPPSLAVFQRAFPRVRLHIRVSDSADVHASVESGRAELGFAGDPVNSVNLVGQVFAHDELALVVPASHRLAMRRRVGIREIASEPFIRRESGSGSRHCLERAMHMVGRKGNTFNVVLEVEGNEGVKEAVLQGRGVAVMSRRSVEKERLAGSLAVVPISGMNLKRGLFAIRDRRRSLSNAAAGFLSCLQSTEKFAS